MRKFLFLFAFISMISLTTAFPASLEVVDRSASPSDPAHFQVNIQNNFSSEQSFRLSIQAGNLDWFFNDGPVTLQPSETGTINVTVTPPVNSFQHNWQFDFRIWRTGTNDFEALSGYYHVSRHADLEVRNISIDNSSLRPGTATSVKVWIRNLGSETLDNYSIHVNYLNRSTEREGETLLPGTPQRIPETEKYQLKVEAPEKIPPGNHTVEVNVRHRGKIVRTEKVSIRIESVKKIFRNCTTEKGLLSLSREFYAENNGNVNSTTTFKVRAPLYATPFVSYSRKPDSETVNQSSKIYTWNTTLAPGEKAQVTYSVNYWPPVAIIIVLSGALLLVWRLREDVDISKEAFALEDGVKVRLTVKNRSGEKTGEVKVADFIPDIASVSRDFDMARPEVFETGEGTELEWFIEGLEPGEERVLEYTVKPRIEVEEGITLEPAEVRKDDESLATSSTTEVEFSPK
ncbi:MAG: hypothetical protein ABEK00_00090 [Candidatus Nanohaloarchaea archaeon]